MPEAMIPILVLLARHLSVLGCGIEAGVCQMFLKKSQAVPGIIRFHCVNGKGITQSVWRNSVNSAGFRVSKCRHPCLVGTLFYDLPGSVPVDAEDERLAVLCDGAAALDVLANHGLGLTVNR